MWRRCRFVDLVFMSKKGLEHAKKQASGVRSAGVA